MVNFIKAIVGAITKTTKLVGILEKMLTQEVEDEQMPRMVTLMEDVDTRFASMEDWAERFGVGDPSASSGGVRAKRARR